MTITLNNDYEKAIVNLALRQYAQKELQKAVTAYENGKLTEGNDASTSGQTASAIADRIS